MWCLTPGISERGFCGFPAISAASVIKGETLVPSPRHHLGVLDQVLHHCGGLDPEDPSAVGVRQEDGPAHGVCSQVVFVCWAVTAREGRARVSAFPLAIFS